MKAILPARQPKKAKRTSRWRPPTYRAFIRTFACCACGSMQNVECAHVRWQSGAGMGEKPDDYLTVPLCHDCHHGDQHTKMGEPAFWTRYANDNKQTVFQLMDALNRAEPKFWREIQAWKAVA